MLKGLDNVSVTMESTTGSMMRLTSHAMQVIEEVVWNRLKKVCSKHCVLMNSMMEWIVLAWILRNSNVRCTYEKFAVLREKIGLATVEVLGTGPRIAYDKVEVDDMLSTLS